MPRVTVNGLAAALAVALGLYLISVQVGRHRRIRTRMRRGASAVELRAVNMLSLALIRGCILLLFVPGAQGAQELDAGNDVR